MVRVLCPAVLVAFATACGGGAAETPADTPTEATATVPLTSDGEAPTSPSHFEATPTLWDGVLTEGDEGWWFEPSEGDAGPANLDAGLVDAIVALGVESESYIVVTPGRRDGDTWVLGGWHCVGISSTCRPVGEGTTWAVHGTEPFWGLTLSADGGRFTMIDEADTVILTARSEDSFTYELRPPNDDVVWTMTLDPTPCSDGMADALWAWTVALDTGGGSPMRGCAQPGQ